MNAIPSNTIRFQTIKHRTGRSDRRSLAGLTAAIALMCSLGLSADTFAACNFGSNDELKPYGDIGNAWRRVGGESSHLGCPLTGETDIPGGRQQAFQGGVVAWTPPHRIIGACNYGNNSVLKPYGSIGSSWEALGGDMSPLGCPVGPEEDAQDGPGRKQTFQYGQVSWSPGRGSHPILIAYQAGQTAIELLWLGTEPENYDFWIVRGDGASGNLLQQDIKAERNKGYFVFRNATPGQAYSFVVEGCLEADVVGRKAICRQGWLNRVAVGLQPNPIKTEPTLPDPPGRGTSCALRPGCVADTVKQAADIIAPIAKAIGF